MAASWAAVSAAYWVGRWVDWVGVKAASSAANLAEHSVANLDTLRSIFELYQHKCIDAKQIGNIPIHALAPG